MIITEIKLRQIVKQELLNILEAKQPTEDLAIFHKLLNQLVTFHFAGQKEQQTLSFLTNEMIPTLDNLINQIENANLSKLDEGLVDTIKYFFKKQQDKPSVHTETDLQLAIREVKNKLTDLRDTIFRKRAGMNKQYQKYHDKFVLSILQELQNKLQSLIDSNTRYSVTPNFTKRDTLKSLERGQT